MKFTTCLMFILFAPSLLFDNGPEPIRDADEIARRSHMAVYYPGEDFRATVKMTITKRVKEIVTKEFDIYRKDIDEGGDQKYFVHFTAPSDVKDTTFLVHKHVVAGVDDERTLYILESDQFKEISFREKRGKFLGSDLLYEEVSGRNITNDLPVLIDVTDEHYVLRSNQRGFDIFGEFPKNLEGCGFVYYTSYIDRKNFLPMKTLFWWGTIRRVIKTERIEVIQGHPTIVQFSITDNQSSSKTVLELSNIEYDSGLDDAIFSKASLRNPPKEMN